jgi:hypothetical protein
MANTYNLTGTDASVMVPVLCETGSLMAYVLYEAPTGLLRDPYSCMSSLRAVTEHLQTIPRASDTYFPSTSCGNCRSRHSVCGSGVSIQYKTLYTLPATIARASLGGGMNGCYALAVAGCSPDFTNA